MEDNEYAVTREETGALVDAMKALEDLLSVFERKLREGKAFTENYRDGLCFARQLEAHVVALKSLASSSVARAAGNQEVGASE